MTIRLAILLAIAAIVLLRPATSDGVQHRVPPVKQPAASYRIVYNAEEQDSQGQFHRYMSVVVDNRSTETAYEIGRYLARELPAPELLFIRLYVSEGTSLDSFRSEATAGAIPAGAVLAWGIARDREGIQIWYNNEPGSSIFILPVDLDRDWNPVRVP